MRRALVLFTCDLRVRENPALSTAVAAREQVVPAYVHRYVPELGARAGASAHEPWRLPAGERRRLGYPQPIVDPGSVGLVGVAR